IGFADLCQGVSPFHHISFIGTSRRLLFCVFVFLRCFLLQRRCLFRQPLILLSLLLYFLILLFLFLLVLRCRGTILFLLCHLLPCFLCHIRQLVSRLFFQLILS